MDQFVQLTVVGLVVGCVYALAAMGLVVTYTTSGIFNFAHGAVAAVAAFGYWDLAVAHGWPHWLAAIVIVLLFAPVAGALVERVVMRHLGAAPLEAQLAVTVGLLLLLIGVANAVWDPSRPYEVPYFLGNTHVSIAGVTVRGSDLLIMGVAIAVAVGLRFFLVTTQTGVAMRAVVDNRELVGLTGARPHRYGQFGWMLGFGLAALAGILIAPSLVPEFTVTNVTLLVMNGYVAAVIGRLSNLPLTFAGGIFLGLAENYAKGYIPSDSSLATYTPAVSMIVLVGALLVLPQARLRAGRAEAVPRPPRVAGLWTSLMAGALVIVIGVVAAHTLSATNLSTASHGVAYALIGLSVLLLTGYGGAVMLCPLTFAGIGAFATLHVGHGGSWLGILAAVGLSAGAGALLTLPALRLRGLYLALLTLAFAFALDAVWFPRTGTFLSQTLITADRVHIPGVPLSPDTANGDQYMFIVEVVAFVALGVALLAVRRSRFGRRLVAMSDSPAAFATLGLRIPWNKLAVFSASAALAGFGGAIYVQQQGNVSYPDFTLLGSLSLVLIIVIFGVRSVAGVLVAGLLLAIGQIAPSHLPDALRDVVDLAIGLGAIGIARNPNGLFGHVSYLQRRRDKSAGGGPAVAVSSAVSAAPAASPMGQVPHASR
ncbi:MAG: ABC transporter permease subunit [Actinomycetes bacterium]